MPNDNKIGSDLDINFSAIPNNPFGGNPTLGSSSNFPVPSYKTSPTDSQTGQTLNHTDTKANSPAGEQTTPNSKTPNQNENPTTPIPKNQDLKTIITSPHTPQKYGGKKIIATIFSILLLISGVAVGVLLVQRQQQIAERAASSKECTQSKDCILLEDPGNSGTYITDRIIKTILITAKGVYSYLPGETNDGCYHVIIDKTYLSWNKVGEGPSCKDISNVQIKLSGEEPEKTPTPSPTPFPSESITQAPVISAKCLSVKAYDLDWNLLDQNDLKKLKAGEKVRFTVSGETTQGTFDKARFSVNNTLLGETSTIKPGSNEFYLEYTIPVNTKDFSVKGEIHHTDLGWI